MKLLKSLKFKEFIMIKGRMARLPFLGFRILSAILLRLFSAAGNSSGVEALLFILLIAIIWVDIYSSVKRLHDIDASGWWAILMLIPLVNFFLGIVLLFRKGTNGENRFGLPPSTTNNLEENYN